MAGAAVFTFRAAADTHFLAYESLSAEQKQAYAYKVVLFVHPGGHGYALFDLTIPPRAAKLVRGARLYFRDRQNKLLAEAHTGLAQNADGSLSLHLELFSGFGGAELVISTDLLPESASLINVGGFSFKIPTEPGPR